MISMVYKFCTAVWTDQSIWACDSTKKNITAGATRGMAAIIPADVIGYVRLMGRDERSTVMKRRRVPTER